MSIMDNDRKREWLVRQFQAGRIDRRTLMGCMLALGSAALFKDALTGRALADTPKKGGHMRFAMGHGEATDTLDPALVNNGFTTVMAYSITNMLTEVDADGMLQPKLAESWEAADSAKKWVFKIRKGVEFHDGRPLTAKDVVASINHHRGADSKSTAKPMVAAIESIMAEGDRTVVVKLTAGDADLPFTFSTFNFGIYPAKADGGLDWQAQVGTGAYVLKEFRPGIKATLERNANFWQEGRGHFDSGELLAVIDVTARQNALAAGDVDGIDRIDVKTADQLAQQAGIAVEEVKGKLHYTFPMRTDMAPFNDNNVRLALKYAIDREAFLKTVLFGHGSIGNDQPIGPAYRYYADDIEKRSYDPDKAKFHLQKAGLSTLAIDLSAASAAFAGAVDASLLFKEQAAKAGIAINVIQEPNDGYWSNIWMKKPFCAAYWFGTPTEDGILSQAYSAGASWNDSYWNNEKFNALLLEARATLDENKRREQYREIQSLVGGEGGVIIPVFANDVFAISSKVRHGKLANNYEVDGRLFFERWWFA